MNPWGPGGDSKPLNYSEEVAALQGNLLPGHRSLGYVQISLSYPILLSCIGQECITYMTWCHTYMESGWTSRSSLRCVGWWSLKRAVVAVYLVPAMPETNKTFHPLRAGQAGRRSFVSGVCSKVCILGSPLAGVEAPTNLFIRIGAQPNLDGLAAVTRREDVITGVPENPETAAGFLGLTGS